MSEKEIIFCKSGGCTAKLGAGVLEHILEKLPKGEKDPNLLVGYDSKDDASVYRLTDDLAMDAVRSYAQDGSAGGGGSVHVWKNCGGECLKRHLCDGRRGADSPEYRLLSGTDGSECPRRNHARRRGKGAGGGRIALRRSFDCG